MFDRDAISFLVACAALAVAIWALYRSSGRVHINITDPREAHPMPIKVDRRRVRQFVDSLDFHSRRALEGAAGLATARHQFYLDIEHWLLKLLQEGGQVIDKVRSELGVRIDLIVGELRVAVIRFRAGNTAIPEFSSGLVNLLARAYDLSQSKFQGEPIGPGHVLYALLSDPELTDRIRLSTPSIFQIPLDGLRSIL
jgi:type VI secretion system protein VasG